MIPSPNAAARLLDDRLPILITGVAGVAGYNAFHWLRQKYGHAVIGQRVEKNWRFEGDGIVACNLEDRIKMRKLFDQYQFQTVINCGGSCALKSCELDPQMAHRVNVEGTRTLLSVIPRQTRLMHLSIDLVYSGTCGRGDYLENHPTDPVTIYGKTMVTSEREILRERPDACVLRISLPMGISFNGHAGAIDWIQSRFAKRRPATLYFDEIRTPTYVECLTEVIEQMLAGRNYRGDWLPGVLNRRGADQKTPPKSRLVENLPSGLFHAGGPRKLSLYQIAQVVNRVGGYDPDNLIGCPRIEAGPIPPRAGNVTMVSEKIVEFMGYEPFVAWPRIEAHVPTDDDWHKRRDGFTGTPELLASTLYQRPESNHFAIVSGI